jgi:hypothetical protein
MKSRFVKKVDEIPADEIENQVIAKFVKESSCKYRKSLLTSPNFDENITSASNSTFNRAFGHSV